jgi:hypothetical protein
MRSGGRFALCLSAFLAGCVASAPPITPTREVHERCAGQMYFQRATQGRSAPNWNVYDYCVRRAMTTRR